MGRSRMLSRVLEKLRRSDERVLACLANGELELSAFHWARLEARQRRSAFVFQDDLVLRVPRGPANGSLVQLALATAGARLLRDAVHLAPAPFDAAAYEYYLLHRVVRSKALRQDSTLLVPAVPEPIGADLAEKLRLDPAAEYRNLGVLQVPLTASHLSPAALVLAVLAEDVRRLAGEAPSQGPILWLLDKLRSELKRAEALGLVAEATSLAEATARRHFLSLMFRLGRLSILPTGSLTHPKPAPNSTP